MRADSATSSTQYFNSIKVRLERPKVLASKNPIIFQFHKGAIRTAKHLSLNHNMPISIP